MPHPSAVDWCCNTPGRLNSNPPEVVESSMFTQIMTDRLLVRPFEAGDVDALHARRNDPDVSRYQNWSRPFSRSAAEAMVQSLLNMDGPTNDEWWMATLVEHESGTIVGDLAVELTWSGRSAEIGYNLDRPFWGRGFAVEGASALVEYLFETVGVTRVFGMLHPANRASAMVLERCGLVFEGHTKLSYWDEADGPSDDWIYGVTLDAWRAWRDRPRTPPASVELVPVTSANERVVAQLETHKSQEAFVTPVVPSYADALFPEEWDGAPAVPLLYGIEADGAMVGFVMLADTTDHHPEPYLWRFLIDRMHQRRGIGRMAMDAIVDLRRSSGDSSLTTSWSEGRGSPSPFYLAYGFVPTGRMIDDEIEARLLFP